MDKRVINIGCQKNWRGEKTNLKNPHNLFAELFSLQTLRDRYVSKHSEMTYDVNP